MNATLEQPQTVGPLTVDGDRVSGSFSVAIPETSERTVVTFKGAPAKALKRFATQMRARYDAAATTDENRRHWANADNLSAATANNRETRRILRSRCRYEVGNNSYANGMVSTLANHEIGTGPRLQLLTADKPANRIVEAYFSEWADEVNLPEVLRTGRRAKCQDGESFTALVTNFDLQTPVSLDVVSIEADQVSDPYAPTSPLGTDPRNMDGVILGAGGRPVKYRILPEHPGDAILAGKSSPTEIPAANMCHWFTSSRPKQYRGIPELTPGLPLLAQCRRFTLAVISAAEAAALASGVIYSESPATEDDESPEAMDSIELERNMWLTLPKGYKIGQIKAEQPTTTYAEFKREIIKEFARCINMPYNIAAGDSSDMSFASGRLDGQIYESSIWTGRDHCRIVVLRKIVREWIREARLIPGYLPDSIAKLPTVPHTWHWDALGLTDPMKLAQSRDVSIRNGTGSLRGIAAEDGYDIDQLHEENAAALNMTVEEYRAELRKQLFSANQQPQQTPEPQSKDGPDAAQTSKN